MININEKYVGLDKKNINQATWADKIRKNNLKKENQKKTRYHKDFKQQGEVFPKSELDSDDIKEDDSITLSSQDRVRCKSQKIVDFSEYYDSEIDQ